MSSSLDWPGHLSSSYDSPGDIAGLESLQRCIKAFKTALKSQVTSAVEDILIQGAMGLCWTFVPGSDCLLDHVIK